MAKGKNKTKSKAPAPELTKKARKLLEQREAELEQRIAAAERAEAKKAAKAKAKRKAVSKGQKNGKTKSAKMGPTKSADGSESTVHPAIQHLDHVADLMATKADKTKSKRERREAEIELEQLRTEGAARIAANDAAKAAKAKRAEDKTETPLDAATLALKARVAAKVQARNIGIDIDGVDTTNADDVAAVNEALASAGIELTIEHRIPKPVGEARGADALPGESEVDYQLRHRKAKKAGKPEQVAEQVAEQVETEHGREFVVGVDGSGPDADLDTDGDDVDPDAPAEAPIKLTEDGKRYLITRPDGTEARYTRATTFIDGLDDTHGLDAWKLRTLLEGVAVNNEATAGDRDAADYLMGKVSAAIHDRDVAIAKLDKADRKGKLEVGERGLVEVKINQAFKAVVDDVAEQALDLGGAHVKATKGTDLHALTEVADREGIEHIRMLAEAGTITPADLADIEAYVAAMERAGVKVIATEQVVVNDDLGVAGTLDRVLQVPGRLLGRARGAKVVADVKTGNMEYAINKTTMQVTVYATSKMYEAGSPDRTELGTLKPTTARHPGKAPLKKDKPLKRDGDEAMAAYEARVAKYEADLANYNAKRGLALLIHLPQGEARCTVHLIDLNVGAQGLEVIKAMRAWRNEGKRGIDLKADLVAPAEVTA